MLPPCCAPQCTYPTAITADEAAAAAAASIEWASGGTTSSSNNSNSSAGGNVNATYATTNPFSSLGLLAPRAYLLSFYRQDTLSLLAAEGRLPAAALTRLNNGTAGVNPTPTPPASSPTGSNATASPPRLTLAFVAQQLLSDWEAVLELLEAHAEAVAAYDGAGRPLPPALPRYGLCQQVDMDWCVMCVYVCVCMCLWEVTRRMHANVRKWIVVRCRGVRVWGRDGYGCFGGHVPCIQRTVTADAATGK